MTCKALVPFNVLPNMQTVQSTTAGQLVIAQNTAATATQNPVEQSVIKGKALPFTHSQLSLALSIQKSKPADISIRDYCLQLQKHIKSGRPLTKEGQRHIDTAEFWKDQYSRLYSEKEQFSQRTARLELLVLENSRRERGMSSHPEDGEPLFEGVHDASFSANAELYLPHTSTFNGGSILLKALKSPNNLTFLKQALILHQLLRDIDAPTDILLSAILSSLTCLATIIKEIPKMLIQGSKENNNSDSFHTFHLLDTIAAVFNICLKGLSHLCRDIPGRGCKGQAIYAITHFYKTCLNQLYKLCAQEVSFEQSNVEQNENLQSNIEGNRTWRLSALSLRYARFLAKLLQCSELQAADISHREVLEGLLSTLLEATGCLLSRVVFGETLSSLATPDGCTNGMSPYPEGQAAELAGRHLAYVLEKCIQCTANEENRILATMLREPSDHDIGSGQPWLLKRARKRFQETLLKAVFGENGEDFIDALKMPQFAESWSIEPTQVQAAKERTFVEAVWSAVGWDLILSVGC